MKNTDTHKVALPTGDISGKATAPAFAQIMNLLTHLLQLAAFCFTTIKSWSGFAGDF